MAESNEELRQLLEEAFLAMGGMTRAEMESTLAMRDRRLAGTFDEVPGKTLADEAEGLNALVRERIYTEDEKTALQVYSTLLDYKEPGGTGMYPGAVKISSEYSSESVYRYPERTYASPPKKDANGGAIRKIQRVGINRLSPTNRFVISLQTAERPFNETTQTDIGSESPRANILAFIGPGHKFEGFAFDLEFAHPIPLVSEKGTTQGQRVTKALLAVLEAVMIYTSDGMVLNNVRVTK